MTTVVTLFAGGSVGTILAALVFALFNRKKISAEATDLISKAGAGIAQTVESYVRTISDENSEFKKENRELREQILTCTDEVRRLHRELNEIHADTKATREAMERVDHELHDGD